MRAGDWEGAFDEARATEEAAAAHHEERAALLRARLESGLRKVGKAPSPPPSLIAASRVKLSKLH